MLTTSSRSIERSESASATAEESSSIFNGFVDSTAIDSASAGV